MKRLVMTILGLYVGALAGCAAKPTATVGFTWMTQPSKPLAEPYLDIAVIDAEMGGDTAEYDQKKWSRMTADLIQHHLEGARDRQNIPIRLVDREHLKTAMGEKDLALARVSDGGDAMGSAQVKAAKAVLTSKVTVKVDKQIGKKRTIDDISAFAAAWSRGGAGGGHVGTTEVTEESRNITVQCQFQLKDAATNEIIASHNSEPRMRSDKTSASPFFGSSKTEANMTPRDQVIGSIVDEHVRDFLGKLVPMKMETTVTVRPGSHEMSVAGVRALVEEDWAGALSSFKEALKADPDDERSLFGAGVACEKLNDLEQARKYYKRAQAMDVDNEQYRDAVARVSRDG